MKDRICDAIRAKRVLRVRYHDSTRLLEPYLLGEYADGRPVLLVWMVRSEDDPTKQSGWQHYLVSSMQSLEVSEETFDGRRPDYNPIGDGRVQRVICAVSALKLA